mmetsp:Transcript_21957/g.76999  ORF Transcript_21957/g.76999 Transcript_21957/m.76999 type:complete len:244 (-) Transcript_21957:872-1603(-)
MTTSTSSTSSAAAQPGRELSSGGPAPECVFWPCGPSPEPEPEPEPASAFLRHCSSASGATLRQYLHTVGCVPSTKPAHSVASTLLAVVEPRSMTSLMTTVGSVTMTRSSRSRTSASSSSFTGPRSSTPPAASTHSLVTPGSNPAAHCCELLHSPHSTSPSAHCVSNRLAYFHHRIPKSSGYVSLDCFQMHICRRFSATTSPPDRPVSKPPSGSGEQYLPDDTHWEPHAKLPLNSRVQPHLAPS